MKFILGILLLFVFIGPLYVGITTLSAFFTKRQKPLIERTATCREPKFLAIAIILLVLIPAELVYSTLTHVIPSGDYTLDVEYSLYGYKEIFDHGEYQEKEYFFDGVAPVTITIYNDVDYYEDGETMWGESRTRSVYYTDVYLSSVVLECLGGKEFYIDSEIESNSQERFELEYDDVSYQLKLDIGEISDETLGYTLEDRIADVSTRDIIEHCVLLVLDIIGIVGYFVAIDKYKKEIMSHRNDV